MSSHVLCEDCRFNPRAREGRDKAAAMLRELIGVSIHAPARGATHDRGLRQRILVVSIHAPARGATSRPQPPARLPAGFNPRAREGRD